MLLLLLFLLSPISIHTNNCAQADQYECSTSLCYNYYFQNNACSLNSTSSCTPGQVHSNGTCINCPVLTSSNCSLCPDYVWLVVGSGPAQCISCSSQFGAECVRCSSSLC